MKTNTVITPVYLVQSKSHTNSLWGNITIEDEKPTEGVFIEGIRKVIENVNGEVEIGWNDTTLIFNLTRRTIVPTKSKHPIPPSGAIFHSGKVQSEYIDTFMGIIRNDRYFRPHIQGFEFNPLYEYLEAMDSLEDSNDTVDFMFLVDEYVDLRYFYQIDAFRIIDDQYLVESFK